MRKCRYGVDPLAMMFSEQEWQQNNMQVKRTPQSKSLTSLDEGSPLKSTTSFTVLDRLGLGTAVGTSLVRRYISLYKHSADKPLSYAHF